MAIDDAAARQRVRERRTSRPGSGVFSVEPRLPGDPTGTHVVRLRDDVHKRGLAEARATLRALRRATMALGK
ncbi:MAG: hypothetical protein KIS96_12880 [Bauldia sp.]|nr:hypothetical protein [Bauldia sp.]